jgi:hypothetical protein
MRAIVVIANNVVLEESDREPLQVKGDCRCRVYHIGFPLNKNDGVDHLRQLIKPFGPKTFTVTSARDLREAIAAIVSDIAAY